MNLKVAKDKKTVDFAIRVFSALMSLREVRVVYLFLSRLPRGRMVSLSFIRLVSSISLTWTVMYLLSNLSLVNHLYR